MRIHVLCLRALLHGLLLLLLPLWWLLLLGWQLRSVKLRQLQLLLLSGLFRLTLQLRVAWLWRWRHARCRV